MADTGSKRGLGRALRLVFGAALCILAGINVLIGTAWYWTAIGAVAGVLFLLGGGRRIIRAGISRSEGEIVCRYVPWYESNAYVLNVLLPLLSVPAIAASYSPGNPVCLRFMGGVLLGISALFVVGSVRMWRRCFLCVTPSTLRIRGAVGARNWTEIRRDLVQSIEPKVVTNGMGTETLQIEVLYRSADPNSNAIQTVMLGPQATVEPANLMRGLQVWNDGANDDPNDLLDRIEGILRGRSPVGL